MRTPEGWPERSAFGWFRTDIVDKPDGRRVTYYEWSDQADGGDSVDAVAAGADAPPALAKDDGV